jgi:hypothetical protein
MLESRNETPIQLRLFRIYLIAMLFVSMALELLYALLVDDWSLGLGNPHLAKGLTTAGVCIIAAHHLYRIFTIVSLFCQTKTSLANARSYLLVSIMVIALFVLSTTIAFSLPAKAGGNGTVVVIQNLGQASILLGSALAILLPWWLILTRSRKVKEFESKWLRRIRPGKLADTGPTGADVVPHR